MGTKGRFEFGEQQITMFPSGFHSSGTPQLPEQDRGRNEKGFHQQKKGKGEKKEKRK